jgi:hypothetical protein
MTKVGRLLHHVVREARHQMTLLVVAQAAAEYGAMSAIAAGVESALLKIEAWARDGSNAYLVGGAAIVLVVLLLRRRR